MIQRNKDYNKIDFLSAFLDKAASKENITVKDKKQARKELQPQAATKIGDINALFDRVNADRTIRSAHGGTGETDVGGPKKHMGMDTTNTIWNPDALEKIKADMDNKERTQKEIKDNADIRSAAAKERLDEMVKNLQDTDLRKSSTISSASPQSGETYKRIQSSISMFDKDKNFEHIPDKTEGEKVSDRAKLKKEKDQSWHGIKPCASTKSTVSSLFDRLLGDKDVE